MQINHTSRRMLRELHPHVKLLGFVVFIGMVVAAVQPASAKLTQLIIDSLQTGDNDRAFKILPFSILALFVVGGLAKYFYHTYRRRVVELIVLDLRRRMFQKFVSLPVQILDKSRTGELLSSIQNDLTLVTQGADTVFGILKEPLAFLGLLGMAFYFDWRLALYSLLTAPAVVLLFSLPGAAVKRYSTRNLGLFADLISLGQEALVGARVVKVFGLEKLLGEKFRDIQRRYFQTAWKSIRIQELAAPSVELLGAAIMSIILFYGGYRIVSGTMTAGDLIAFILTLGLCQMPIKNLNNAYLKLKAAEAAAERIFSLIDQPEEKREKMAALSPFSTAIRFERVNFAYDSKQVLRNISFEIRCGECVAFVGLSGSGKSTLVNLLLRFYELEEGRITIDGRDIRDVSLSDLRAQLSFVSQDIFLFHDTLYENIRMGLPNAGKSEIVRAAKLAHCKDFVERLPQGYDTILGDRGICLSGGERQRVAIARAILKNAPILVLDEATSNLDSQSEALVQEALETLMEGRTTLMVAHRFSVVSRADRIYVLRNGMCLETGTSEELLEQRGHFAELFCNSPLDLPRSLSE